MNHDKKRRILKSSGLVSGPSVDEAAAALPRLDGNGSTEGKPFMVPLSLICESPYQTSPINDEKVADLMENLGKNPISSPVVLRRGHQGRLEIIAGRHRVEAYKRLGRDEIESTLRDLDDDAAEKLVFYDNLFAPSMTDFQKYLGFSQRKTRLGLTQEQLAEESGVSRTVISKLLSFDGLPDPVFNALKENPQVIGANAAVDFVNLAKKQPDLAIQAIYAIALGDMTQKAALAWLKAGGVTKPESVKQTPTRTLIKSGTHKYAELVQRENRLVISLNAVDKDLYLELQEWLKSRAKQHFQTTNPQEGESEA